MSFTKAIQKKSEQKHADHPAASQVDIRKLISGEPLFDENSVLELDTNQVENKQQVRTQFNEAYIEELGNSMVELGQIQPIVVSPADDNGVHQILKGECRWRAAKRKGIKIRAIIDPRLMSDSDVILGELAENIQRDDLKPLEIANAIAGLKSVGMKQKEIAQKLGKNDAYVSRHIKLLEMPASVSELYHSGTVRDVPTLNNLIALGQKNAKQLEKVCREAQNKGVTRKYSDFLVKHVNDSKQSGSTKIAHAQNSTNGFVDGKAGMFSLQVKDPQGRTGKLCLDRCDDDPCYVWVQFGKKKVRLELNLLVFERVLPSA